MNLDQWSRLEKIFDHALALPHDERRCLIAETRRGDPELATELERLLEGYSDDYLEPTPAAALPRQTLAAGDEIGPYELLEQVGAGGMGVVFLAQLTDPVERVVALKVVQQSDDDSIRQRFWVEQQALASVDHTNVLKLLDSGVTPEGVSYLTTELLDGLPFLEHCTEHSVPLTDRLRLFAEVCDGVEHAHQSGVLHRDIKSENIIIHRDGESWTPKLIDFGIARLQGANVTRVTQHGQIIGTPSVMSPEQAQPGGLADRRSDVFSLGRLLSNLVEESDVESTDKVLRDAAALAHRASAEQPEERYPSAAALGSAVRALTGDHSNTRGGATQSRRVLRWLVAVLVVGGVAVALYQRPPSWQDQLIVESLRLEEAKAQLDTEWPVTPDSVAKLERWLTAFEEPAGGLEEIRLLLGDSPGTIGPEVTALHAIDAFYAGTTIADARERLRVAQRLAANRLSEPSVAAAWALALKSIHADPRYAGVSLSPVDGLVPLDKNPASGLWEFWHVASGERPPPQEDRSAVSRWQILGDTGLVLVLVPPGSFVAGKHELLGATFVASNGRAVVDTLLGDRESGSVIALRPGDAIVSAELIRPEMRIAVAFERGGERHELSVPWQPQPPGLPLRAVELDAYFMSKYEMTIGQLERVTGPHTQALRHLVHANPFEVDRRMHVATWVGFETTRRAVARLGLAIPHDDEWEYAARAGSRGRTWVGDDSATIYAAQIGNFNDTESNDNWRVHAPVGLFAANPWGLHDVFGNAGEWAFEAGVLDGDIAHFRGGTCGQRADQIHAARRIGLAQDMEVRRGGIRPVLRLPQ